VECPDIPGSYSEDFSVDDHCFTRQTGSWNVADGEYFGTNESGRGLSILEGSHSKGRCINADLGVMTGPTWVSYLIFCYHNSLNFWYVKLNANTQQVTIGRVKGGLEQDAVDVSQSISLDTLYDIQIQVSDTGSQSGVIALWVEGTLRTALTVSSDLFEGELGFGVRRSNGIFDNLDILVGSCP
jgi:hypothetical protein